MKKLIFNNYFDRLNAVDKLKEHGIDIVDTTWWSHIYIKDGDVEQAQKLVTPDNVMDCPELRTAEPFAKFLETYYGKGDKIQIPPEIAIVIQENGWSNLLEYPNLICQTDDLTLICIDQDTKHIKTINQL